MISPLSTIKFLTREQDGEKIDIYYYFASFSVGGNTYSGYIPVSFTVPVLSEDFTWDNYTIETVKATAVYSDNNLNGAVIYSLSEGEKVIVTEKNQNSYKIKVKINTNEYIEGYIRIDSIKNQAEITVRNILIIFIVAVSILGTSFFLIFIKKQRKQ